MSEPAGQGFYEKRNVLYARIYNFVTLQVKVYLCLCPFKTLPASAGAISITAVGLGKVFF